jgi:hypothetical protein
MDIDSDQPRWITICAFATLLVCSLLALYRPLIEYDSWWYHLPFSSRIWGIGGGAETFHLSGVLSDRWVGFPKAWEWIQGLAWWATGSLRAIVIPQLLLCAAYFSYTSTHRVPLSWMILAFFASPMLFIHFQATYLDLPAAICVALGFLLVVDLIADGRISGQPFPWLRAIAAITCLGLAGNIKYQALIGALCVSGVLLFVCVLATGIPLKRRAALVVVVLIADLIASAPALWNQFAHHDPFYPLELQVHGKTIFAGPEDPEVDARYPTYARYPSWKLGSAPGPQISLPSPVNFFLSATELDWTLRGVAPWYNVDSNTSELPRQGGPGRTGGWGGVFVFVTGCLLVLQLFRLRSEDDSRQRLLVIATLAVIAATSCLPRAHELRYWLYVPLILIPVNLRYLSRRYQSAIVAGVLFVLMAYGVALTVLSPNSELLTAHPSSAAALRAAMPPKVARALRETGRYCTADDDELPFRFSSAVTGVAGLVSSIATDCGGHPQLSATHGMSGRMRATP